MKAWYVPSANGDLRLEPLPSDPTKTRLRIERPTPREVEVLATMEARFAAEGWLSTEAWAKYKKKASSPLRAFGKRRHELVLDAPMEKVGPVVAKILRPGPAVLTAIELRGGQVVTSSGTEAQLVEEVDALARAAETTPEKTPEKAATVKRATPSCPMCLAGAVEPASEVLQTFLSPDEHERWARTRTLVVEGGLTGHRYLLAHRKTEAAQAMGRMCADLDDRFVVHFHQTDLPPEEEVLAALLVLRHREHWLRNEATVFGPYQRFKNPFGDKMDGVGDANLTAMVGGYALGFAGMRAVQRVLSA